MHMKLSDTQSKTKTRPRKTIETKKRLSLSQQNGLELATTTPLFRDTIL